MNDDQVIRLNMPHHGPITRARFWLADRLVPAGWYVVPKPSGDTWVAEAQRGIERIRDLTRAADAIAEARRVVAILADGDDDEPLFARLAIAVVALQRKLDLLDHGNEPGADGG